MKRHMDPDQTPQSQTSSPGKTGASSPPTVILEPSSVSVPVPGTPWYKRIFGGGTRTQTVWKLSFVMIFMIAIFATINTNTQHPQTIETKAGMSRARVSLLPTHTTLPPDTDLQLWVTTDVTVTEGQFEISFDSTKLTVVDAKLPYGSPLKNAVTITPSSQANANGKILVVFTPTANNVTPPSGTFEVVGITFHSASPVAKGTTDVFLTTEGTSLYHEKTPFAITGVSKSTFILEAGQ
jgi:hypothetical protein